MTVIAYRDGVMAGDGRVALGKTGDIITDTDVKVFRIGEYVFGFAGHGANCLKLKAAMETGNNIALKDTYGLRASPGLIELYEGSDWYPVTESYMAIGIGEVAAMTAMDMGASALEAVKAAFKRNCLCGGKITKVTL